MICHYCTYKKDTEASEALTNQRASCIAWQLCLTIHNFRLLMKAPRTLMTKLPSNCLLKLRPLRLVLFLRTCFTEGGCGGQGDKYYFPDKQYKNLPLAVTTFSTRPCPALCYTTFHPSPNNRLASSAPDGSIKTKRKHSAKQLPQQWFHHNWQGSRGPLKVPWRRMQNRPTMKTIRHHSPLCTCAGLAGA